MTTHPPTSAVIYLRSILWLLQPPTLAEQCSFSSMMALFSNPEKVDAGVTAKALTALITIFGLLILGSVLIGCCGWMKMFMNKTLSIHFTLVCGTSISILCQAFRAQRYGQ
jgi:hypothetical protein